MVLPFTILLFDIEKQRSREDRSKGFWNDLCVFHSKIGTCNTLPGKSQNPFISAAVRFQLLIDEIDASCDGRIASQGVHAHPKTALSENQKIVLGSLRLC